MPSGGGFAGGGGGGGGFSSSSSGGRSSSEKSSPCIICLSLVLTVVLIVVIVIPIEVTKRSDSSDIATNFYSPGDSRLVSFKSFFCDGINVRVNSVAIGVSVFVVNTPPPLTEQNNFTVTNSKSIGSNEFRFWQYYLYPNSNISISVCSDSGLDLYIVKGMQLKC